MDKRARTADHMPKPKEDMTPLCQDSKSESWKKVTALRLRLQVESEFLQTVQLQLLALEQTIFLEGIEKPKQGQLAHLPQTFEASSSSECMQKYTPQKEKKPQTSGIEQCETFGDS
jgi:hypothetical protein